MPDLLTGPPDDPESVTLALPDNSSVPLPPLPGVDVSQGVAAVVPGTAPGHYTLQTVSLHYLLSVWPIAAQVRLITIARRRPADRSAAFMEFDNTVDFDGVVLIIAVVLQVGWMCGCLRRVLSCGFR
jgi:hypothetical protein